MQGNTEPVCSYCLLVANSNQSNLSLSLQKPICLRCLYMQYTQSIITFISNNKIIHEHVEIMLEICGTYFSHNINP
jgi:hypothetical protein